MSDRQYMHCPDSEGWLCSNEVCLTSGCRRQSPSSDDTILDPIVHTIASMLDHPSVYMGGPSHGSIRKAKEIIEEVVKPLEAQRDAWKRQHTGTLAVLDHTRDRLDEAQREVRDLRDQIDELLK